MIGLEAGDTLVCDESRGDDPRHDFGESGLGERFPRFCALVDRVQGDYVEATVTRRNPHLKSPDPGAELALSAATIAADPRWRLA
jgi:hypothetical protein